MIKSASKPNIDQKLLSLLVTSVKDYAIFMIDPQGYIISWNKGAERIKGYRESEIIGQHISVFYTQADIEKNEPQHNLNEALKNGSYEDEGWRVRKDGSIFWANAIFTPLFDEDQKLLGFAKVTRDVTERKKTDDRKKEQYIELEKQAKENTEKVLAAEVHYRKLIENSYDGIALFDKALNVYYRSPSARRITGWGKEERNGLGIDDIVHPDDRTLVSGIFLNILNKPEEPVICTYRVRHNQGHYIWLECVFNNKLDDPDMRAIVCNFRDVTARKEADLLLQKTIKELSAYRYALDESAIVAITDQKGIIQHVNDNFCRISKYSREELLGQDHRIINSAYHDKLFIASLWKTIANGKIWRGELKNKAKDGTNYWVDTTIVPFFNEKGKPYQYVAIRSDITERKRLEELLNKTTKLARIGGWEIDLVKGTYYWSDITKEIHEVGPEYEPTPEKSVSFYPDEAYRTALTSLMQDAISNGTPGDVELQITTPKGNHKWIRVIVESEFIDGKCSKIYGSCQDIDARKKAEILGKKALEERNQILESIDDAFFAIDKNWIVTYWNKMAEKVLLTPKDKILGHNLWEIFSDSVGSESYKNYHAAVETGLAAHFEDYHPPLDKWYEISAYPSDTGLSVYFKDVTDRKNSETHLKELNESLQNHAKELAASNEELEQFAYVASHDLQEPLRMVTGFLTQLEKKYQDVIDEKGKQYIYFAVDGAKRMRQIILDLLEYSRAGKTVAGLERISLNKLMDEMRVLYRKQLDAGAKVLNDELPVIISYKTSLWQVLQNLIGNALKYHRKDVVPVVTLTCSETNTHWQFCVEDNGIGIESEYFTKIFIIFQRLHRKGEYSGTGIGLAIAKKLVENLGGKIWVDSVKNESTKFYFTILKNETL